jgi:hypothetical protein
LRHRIEDTYIVFKRLDRNTDFIGVSVWGSEAKMCPDGKRCSLDRSLLWKEG